MKTGRPAFEPTAEQIYSVELMASIGLTHVQIAGALGICDKTLRKHFSEQLEHGRARTITTVADSLMRQAIAGNMQAAIFYLRAKAGWKETTVNELTGADGGAIKSESSLSDEDRQRLDRLNAHQLASLYHEAASSAGDVRKGRLN